MATREVKVPDIGDFKDVPIIQVFVKPGDAVKREDPLISLESDKATMDVPSPVAGTVKEVQVKVGDRVSEGRLILVVETAEEGAQTSAAKPAAQPSREGGAPGTQGPGPLRASAPSPAAPSPGSSAAPASPAGRPGARRS